MDQAQTSLKPRILVAPLDWGLGHATRSVPVIRELVRQGAEVVLAGSGKVKYLLEKEFPQLTILELKGYNISYSKNKWSLPFVIATQIPKIISAIDDENEMIDEIIAQHQVNGIISDNRFGLYHENIPSVFITHQLLIKTNLGHTVDEYLQKINYSFINKFTECWVPDHQGKNNLAGELSHPAKLPVIPTKYIGPLSRFENHATGKEKHLLILLSGPEPQRTILEELILEQLKSYQEAVVVVRGLPGEENIPGVPSNVEVINHLPANQLNEKILDAWMVIARCGYSTVMDLSILGKKSILIPTPGQTEQEYLSRHLMQTNFALCIEQQKFKLIPALGLARNFQYSFHSNQGSGIEEAVSGFLKVVSVSKE